MTKCIRVIPREGEQIKTIENVVKTLAPGTVCFGVLSDGRDEGCFEVPEEKIDQVLIVANEYGSAQIVPEGDVTKLGSVWN